MKKNQKSFFSERRTLIFTNSFVITYPVTKDYLKKQIETLKHENNLLNEKHEEYKLKNNSIFQF